MFLSFLPANQAYAFRLGESLIRLDGEPMFFLKRELAVSAANRLGLDVDKSTGAVTCQPDATLAQRSDGSIGTEWPDQ